ncbi:ABC transporter permease [Frankia sp. CNm7]|uniref:ABC transporter permease n=1 Tax=Frankia nepalensis TaxID=1836974 RepID=A0A937RN04_9ACTN|nr:ABC transporter permease [Frankia nepalensis]MBL7501994.1 ABC transporter permease [Frankia nepalensis]MBL7510624.1 ABC transporter permease [Frankia nepalensis]MBL7517364.1 ABC transporter permease [Frankia nepalensis]MBL7633447.1 ABC transporter permease [Frankia nepalensis]
MLGRLVGFRLMGIVPQLALVSVAIFLLTYLIPGSPAAVLLGPRATPEGIAELEERLGLDQPLVVQFVEWVGGVLRGDLGTSWFGNKPVTKVISEHLLPTISLTVGGILVAILLGMSAGIVAALRPGALLDRIVGLGTATGLAVPSFWLGVILLGYLAVQLGWFPVLSWTPPSQDVGLWLRGLVLPSIAVGIAGSAVIARHTRSAMLETLAAPYVQTLRAMGTPRRTIVARYAIKNTMVPILSVIAFQLSTLIAASFVVEQVFTIPGIGTQLINAVARKDVPVVQGITLVVAAAVIMIYLLADIGYALLNPRARPQ